MNFNNQMSFLPSPSQPNDMCFLSCRLSIICSLLAFCAESDISFNTDPSIAKTRSIQGEKAEHIEMSFSLGLCLSVSGFSFALHKCPYNFMYYIPLYMYYVLYTYMFICIIMCYIPFICGMDLRIFIFRIFFILCDELPRRFHVHTCRSSVIVSVFCVNLFL